MKLRGTWNMQKFGAESMKFDGITCDKKTDGARMRSQLDSVRKEMKSGKWFTLDELSALCGGSVASISARIRDLRKDKFGALPMQGRRIPGVDGLWEYRMILNAGNLPCNESNNKETV